MNLKELQHNWNEFGKRDPLWAIITHPDKQGRKWKLADFFELGRVEIEEVLGHAKALGVEIRRGKALDFGCGVGRVSQALANHFEEVNGVDIAPAMLKKARKWNRHGSRCKYCLNENEDLKLFQNDTFDFIYTNIVLQHMVPFYAKSYVREFLRVLKPQGTLIFQLPSERIAEAAPREPQPAPTAVSQADSTARRIRRVIKRLSPGPVVRWYVKIRYERAEPRMEMHCIKREEVIAFLKENGADVLDVIDYPSAGPGFVSFRYTVKRAIR